MYLILYIALIKITFLKNFHAWPIRILKNEIPFKRGRFDFYFCTHTLRNKRNSYKYKVSHMMEYVSSQSFLRENQNPFTMGVNYLVPIERTYFSFVCESTLGPQLRQTLCSVADKAEKIGKLLNNLPAAELHPERILEVTYAATVDILCERTVKFVPSRM